MNAWIIVFLGGIAPISALISTGNGIICYQCSTWEHGPACWNVKQNDTSNRFAKFCDTEDQPVNGTGPFFCRTIRQQIRDGNGTYRLWRKCGWEPYYHRYGKECYRNSDGHHEEEVCQCFFDYCNSATSFQVSPIALFASIAVALVFSPLQNIWNKQRI